MLNKHFTNWGAIFSFLLSNICVFVVSVSMFVCVYMCVYMCGYFSCLWPAVTLHDAPVSAPQGWGYRLTQLPLALMWEQELGTGTLILGIQELLPLSPFLVSIRLFGAGD